MSIFCSLALAKQVRQSTNPGENTLRPNLVKLSHIDTKLLSSKEDGLFKFNAIKLKLEAYSPLQSPQPFYLL